MQVKVPTIRSTMIGFGNLARISDDAALIHNGHVQIDFSNCAFFDANMVAPLQAVLRKFVDSGNTIELVNIPQNIIQIFCKNQFLCEYGYKKIFDHNKTALPFIRFEISDAKEFANYLDVYLERKGIPKMSDGLLKKFKQSIFEVFANCMMHSKSLGGVYVCGQFYPKENHLDLTISDVGVGIRTNVRKFLKEEISSQDAIKWAMIEGNTTKTGSQPGGFGLKLLQEFIELNNGKVHIASRDGFYEFSGGVKRYAKLSGDFPGTTINFQINTSDKKSYRLSSETKTTELF
jgi:hypothetical protein